MSWNFPPQTGDLKSFTHWGGQQGFLYWGDGRSPSLTGQKFVNLSPTRKGPPVDSTPSFYYPPPKVHSLTKLQLLHYNPLCTIMYHFYFTFTSLHTQVMLIMILINVQYLENVVFNFEKGSSGQNHSLSDSHHAIEKSPQANFPSPYPVALFGKPWAKD